MPTPSSSINLNWPALQSWLVPQVPGIATVSEVVRIEGGQSNPSWLLQGEAGAWVVRAKPAPASQLLPSAHAIEREFRILQALRSTPVPVPSVCALCEDEAVVGVAFYVMEFVPGRIFRNTTLPDVPVGARSSYFGQAAQVLATLHQVDWRALGLANFGRPGHYFSRLIRRWSEQYRASVVSAIPAMDALCAWLPEHIPQGADGEAHTVITHGDFRLENLIFDPIEPRVVAILDWELCTLGHPLSDLAYSALAWHLPSGILRGFADHDLSALAIPSESEYLACYAERMGWDLAVIERDWSFYLAFNLFRLSAILAGVAHRARSGLASNRSAHEIGAMAEPVAQIGWRIAARGLAL